MTRIMRIFTDFTLFYPYLCNLYQSVFPTFNQFEQKSYSYYKKNFRAEWTQENSK